jgi:predicted ATPase
VARVSCPTFVGRGWELGRLEEAFARASEGMAGMVVVGGDAGIGKTRLLDEFAAQVKDRARVLVGSCVALGEGTLPYAPVVEVLRQVASVHDKEGTEALMGPGSGVLGRLLPEVVMVESATRRVPKGRAGCLRPC